MGYVMGCAAKAVVWALCLGTVAAFPQRTSYANSSTVATKTSSLSGTGTTLAPSLTTSCFLFFPVDISLNSWHTKHESLTVETVVTNYIQYNNTQIAVNTSRITGFMITLPDTLSNDIPMTARFTKFEDLSKTGFNAANRVTIDGIPTDLIRLIPTSSQDYDYAMSVFHTNSDTTTTFVPNVTQIVASPTPYVVPDFVQINLNYYDGTSLVSSTYIDDFITKWPYGLGGPWPTTPVDWPCLTTFSAVPTQFVDWMLEYPGISSSYPFLSSCTHWTKTPPTGAPTVHIVVSTLTHETSSAIATVNGNYGSKSSAKISTSSLEVSETKSGKVSSTEVTSTTLVAVKTSGSQVQRTSVEEKTSDVEQTSAAKQTSIAEQTSTEDQTSVAEQTSAERTSTAEQTSNVEQTSAAEQTSTTEQISPAGQTSAAERTSTAEQTSNVEHTSATNRISTADQVSTADQISTTEQAPTADQHSSATAVATSKPSSGIEASPATAIIASEKPSESKQTTVDSQSASNVVAPTPSAVDSSSDEQATVPVTTPGGNKAVTGSYSETEAAITQTSAQDESSKVVVGTSEPSHQTSVVAQEGSSASTPSEETAPADNQGTNPEKTTAQSSIAIESSTVSTLAEDSSTVLPALTFKSTTITPNSASEYVFSTQTLAPGGSEITVEGTTYSLATSAAAVIQNGVTQTLTPEPTVKTTPELTLGSAVITANSESAFVYESQTLSAGGSAITAGGDTYSLASSGSETHVVLNGATTQTAVQPSAPEVTIGSIAITADSASASVYGSRTLSAGGSAVTASGTTYSIATSGSETYVVANGATQPVAQSSAPEITLGNTVVTAAPSVYVLGSQTLSPGGSEITVGQKTYSLVKSGSSTYLVEDGVTPPEQFPPVVIVATPAITLGSSIITANSASEYVIGSQTLAAGSSAITEGGTTYSLANSGSALVVNGATQDISQDSATQAYIVAGHTLSQGFEVEVSGVTYSLALSATAVVVNGITSAFPESTAGVLMFGSAPATSVTDGYVVAGQTITSGSEVTVSGTTYSLASTGGAIVVNGVTSEIAPESPEILTFGSALATPTASGYIVADQTLEQSSQITVSGTTYSLAPSGTAIVINGVTSSLPTPETTTPEYIIGSLTLNPGSAVTVSGTTYSLAASALGSSAEILVNGGTSTIPTPAVFTLGTSTNTAIPAASSALIIDGQTLYPSERITLGDSATLTLAANGSLETIASDGMAEIISSSQSSEHTSTSTKKLSGSRTLDSSSASSTGIVSTGAQGSGALASSSSSSAAASRQTHAVGFGAGILALAALGVLV